jgi:hypothetical protein
VIFLALQFVIACGLLAFVARKLHVIAGDINYLVKEANAYYLDAEAMYDSAFDNTLHQLVYERIYGREDGIIDKRITALAENDMAFRKGEYDLNGTPSLKEREVAA